MKCDRVLVSSLQQIINKHFVSPVTDLEGLPLLLSLTALSVTFYGPLVKLDITTAS